MQKILSPFRFVTSLYLVFALVFMLAGGVSPNIAYAAPVKYQQGGNALGELGILGLLDNFGLSFITNGIERARISATGNFGIGTSNPEAKLHVNGGEFWLFNGGQNPRMVLGDTGTTGQYGFAQWDSANDYYRLETDGTNGLKIKGNNVSIGNIFPSEPLLVASGASELFRVDDSGSVGVGTSLPSYKLDVQGGQINSSGGLCIAGDCKTAWNQVGGGTPGGPNGSVQFNDNGSLGGSSGLIWDNVTNRLGINAVAPEFALTLDNDGGILAKGDFGVGTSLVSSGPGSRFIWYPKKGALRAGYVFNSKWNDSSIGNYSVALGLDSLAQGAAATALGSQTSASGQGSTALGFQTTASGLASLAAGENTIASGRSSFAIGLLTKATENFSTAMGEQSIASGQSATAIGNTSVASGQNSFAVGRLVTAGSARNTMVFGRGVDSPSLSPLINNVEDSFMVGFNSTVPTLFVGPSSGVGTSGNVGIGTSAPGAKLHVSGGDAAIDSQGSGVVLKATDGPNCYRVTVDNAGSLTTALVACP